MTIPKHTEFSVNETIDEDEKFSFHGLKLRFVVDPSIGDNCAHCAYKTRMRELKQPVDCDDDNMPGCNHGYFEECGFTDEREFRAWQVIVRMGLDDKPEDDE